MIKLKKNPNILERLKIKEEKAGVRRLSVDSAFGKTCKVVYIISFVYALCIKLIYMLSTYFQASYVIKNTGYENLTAHQLSQYSDVKNSLLLVGIGAVLLIAALILLCKRIFAFSLPINAAVTVTLCVHFAFRMSETLETYGLASSYTYYHLAPLALLLISSTVYCIIGIRNKVLEDKAYTAFVDRLYENHSKEIENLTDEEWEEFLSNYDPRDYR